MLDKVQKKDPLRLATTAKAETEEPVETAGGS